MTNDMYWITTFIFSVVLIVIWIDVKRDMKKQTRGDKAFLVMLGYGIFFCLQDMFWGLCASNIVRGENSLFVASSIFHLAIVLTSYYCMKFFLSYLEEYIKHKKLCVSISVVIIAVQVVLVISNFFKPILFRIENGEYAPKILRPLSFTNQYLVYFISGIITFLCVKRADKKHKDRYRAIFCVAVLPLITGIFQLYYVEAPFYSLGYFLECIIIHMFIITREKNEFTREVILDSIANTYYSMHLFDLEENYVDYFIESPTVQGFITNRNDIQGSLNNVVKNCVTDEYLDVVSEFVELKSLSSRMKNCNSISVDFIGKFHGWTRASVISVERDMNRNQKKVMFMTQIIDEQKKREQEMFAKSHTDQLTKLLNRRAYENDLGKMDGNTENMVYVSVDVNELKVVNDAIGHEAGDELLKGAATCMKQCFGPYGKVYRIGGDEFVVVIYATDEELAKIQIDFARTVNSWKGELVDNVSVSCGYVARKEFPDISISELAKTADKRMYQEKANYYKAKGVDRRGQAAAHTALCNLYTKILKVNLTKDSYHIVNMDMSEQTKDKGFSDKISEWLENFGKSGQVHEEDLDEYLKKTDVRFLSEYFKSGKTSISIYYRRKYAEGFKQVAMEMIPADDYSNQNQTLFLYVKDIDKETSS